MICDKCLEGLEKVEGGCVRCGKKTNDIICNDCLFWEQNKDYNLLKVINYSLYYYNEYAKTLVKKIKFNGDIAILLAFRQQIKKFLKPFPIKDKILVPVPLFKTSLQKRGFNQSEVIARIINLPILDNIYKSNDVKQSKKKRIARIVFDDQYRLKSKLNLHNKDIIIIDDIYTTGATVHKIAKLLSDCNARNICSFTLFRS
jgi:competence protein ComFC